MRGARSSYRPILIQQRSEQPNWAIVTARAKKVEIITFN
jgi:hypothetical protein